MTDEKQGKGAGAGEAGRAGGASPPGMMGDGTEEQNLGQPGEPGARITQEEVEEAFDKDSGRQPESPDR